MVNKAYLYRLYPITEQKIMFAKTFGCARFIYNKMLIDRLDYYDEADADYPNFLRKAEKKLAKAQRKLSKRQKGSRNRDKQRLYVARLHEKIANQRCDFLHKKSRYFADRYDVIGIEDISVKSMAKHKKGGKFSFGKSVADNGWNMFNHDKNAAINIQEEARRISA